MCSIWLLRYCLYPYNPLALKVHYSIWSAGKLFQYDLLYFLFIARWDLCHINSAAIPFLLGSRMSLWEINIELCSSVCNTCHKSLDVLTVVFVKIQLHNIISIIKFCIIKSPPLSMAMFLSYQNFFFKRFLIQVVC